MRDYDWRPYSGAQKSPLQWAAEIAAGLVVLGLVRLAMWWVG